MVCKQGLSYGGVLNPAHSLHTAIPYYANVVYTCSTLASVGKGKQLGFTCMQVAID